MPTRKPRPANHSPESHLPVPYVGCVKIPPLKRTSHAFGELILLRGIGLDPLSPVWTAVGAPDQSKDILGTANPCRK